MSNELLKKKWIKTSRYFHKQFLEKFPMEISGGTLGWMPERIQSETPRHSILREILAGISGRLPMTNKNSRKKKQLNWIEEPMQCVMHARLKELP